MKLLKPNLLLFIGSFLSFLVPFLFYIKGLAPSVTLEDSGEFITAAYHFGIPHPPGYPPYILLSGIFLKLPFLVGSPAWKMNLFSALTFALSGIFIFLSCINIMKAQAEENLDISDMIFGVTAALLALLAPHVFRQAVITEVYGLHSLIWSVCIFILTLMLYKQDKSNLTNTSILVFLFSLGLIIHPLMIALLFICLGLYPYLFKDLFNKKKNLMLFGLSALTGLLPLIYLPIRAQSNPIINWGETFNFDNFIAHILREQYAPKFFRNTDILIEQLRQQVIYLFEQFNFVLILIGLIGLTLIFLSKYKKWFYFSLFTLICTGPLTAIFTNFNLDLTSQIEYEETSSLNSVFYLVHYQIWGILIIFGLRQLISYFSNKLLIKCCSTLFLLYSLFLGYKNLLNEDKSKDSFAEQNLHNLEVLFNNLNSNNKLNTNNNFFSALTNENSKPIGVVITNWDPFSFPMIYFQNVERRATNIVVIDVEMLKAPWYIHQLQKWYPYFCKSFEYQFNAYLDDYSLFKKNNRVAPIKSYLEMIEKIIHHSVYSNIPTLLMIDRQYFKLPPINLSDYNIEPAIVGSLIRKKNDISELKVTLQQFAFDGFEKTNLNFDRLHKMLARYYSTLLVEKAEMDMIRHPTEYKATLEKALYLVRDQTDLAEKIKKRHSL
jgi:hypothetical protein